MATAFFDAYLRGDANALNWPDNKSIGKVTGYVVFEHKQHNHHALPPQR